MPKEENIPVHTTQIIHQGVPWATLPEMTDVVKDMVKELLDRKPFNIVLQEDSSPNSNVIPIRFLLAIKPSKGNSVKFKARFFTKGHQGKLKKIILNSSETIQSSWVTIPLSFTVVNHWDICSSDVPRAYLNLQSFNLQNHSLKTSSCATILLNLTWNHEKASNCLHYFTVCESLKTCGTGRWTTINELILWWIFCSRSGPIYVSKRWKASWSLHILR